MQSTPYADNLHVSLQQLVNAAGGTNTRDHGEFPRGGGRLWETRREPQHCPLTQHKIPDVESGAQGSVADGLLSVGLPHPKLQTAPFPRISV